MLSALLLTYLAGALADCYLRARLLLTRSLLCSAAHALPVPHSPQAAHASTTWPAAHTHACADSARSRAALPVAQSTRPAATTAWYVPSLCAPLPPHPAHHHHHPTSRPLTRTTNPPSLCSQDEGGGNRNNNNRLMDTQNNAKGGYGYGGSANNQAAALNYMVGSELSTMWTSQHSCGSENSECQIVIQAMCNSAAATPDGVPGTDTGAGEGPIRDGTDNGTPDPNNPDANTGLHEPASFYADCDARARNGGLYTADQNMNNNNGARATRQNPNGNRSGQECPEERDYYPHARHGQRGRLAGAVAVATTGSSGCVRRRGAALRTREERLGTSDPTERPRPWSHAPSNSNSPVPPRLTILHRYWHPSPWKDVAIMTNNLALCAWYQQESQNVKPKSYCSVNTENNAADCAANGGDWLEQVVMPLASLSPLSLSLLSSLLPPLLSPHMPPPISSRAGGLWHPAARVRRRPLPARQPPRRRPDRPGGRLQLDDPDGVGRRRRRRRDRLRRALPVQHHHERRAPWVVMSLPHSGASPPCAGTTSPRATCASAPTRPSTRRRRARRRG